MTGPRIAAVGQSDGAQTVGMLLGARVSVTDGIAAGDMSDSRIKARVLLSAPGVGGAALTPFAVEHFAFMSRSFTEMTTPSLVVAGDNDDSLPGIRGPDWFADAYPGATALLTLFGGEHLLGGITGYRLTDTTDESPQRVAAVQELTTAWLRSALYQREVLWSEVTRACTCNAEPQGWIDRK